VYQHNKTTETRVKMKTPLPLLLLLLLREMIDLNALFVAALL